MNLLHNQVNKRETSKLEIRELVNNKQESMIKN